MQMENSSSNQSLSSIKKHYYALAKEVRGIESRVMRLEEEDEKQRRKLENLKNKNHQLQDLKDEKGHREAELLRNQQNNLKQLEMYKTKNLEGRSYHSKVVSELKDTISQQRKTNFKEIREERSRNEVAIHKTKESFVKFNRSIRDRVMNMELESRNHIKNYWFSKCQNHAEKVSAEMDEYKRKIEKLRKAEERLEEKEQQILGSLELTQSAAKHEQHAFQTMTSGIRSIR